MIDLIQLITDSERMLKRLEARGEQIPFTQIKDLDSWIMEFTRLDRFRGLSDK